VGTAPEHERRCLGKAVITEGLRRLQRKGARELLPTASIPRQIPFTAQYWVPATGPNHGSRYSIDRLLLSDGFATLKLNDRNCQDEDDYWRIRPFLRAVFLHNQGCIESWQTCGFEYGVGFF